VQPTFDTKRTISVGIKFAADLGAGLPCNLIEQAVVCDVLHEHRRDVLGLNLAAILVTSLAEASLNGVLITSADHENTRSSACR